MITTHTHTTSYICTKTDIDDTHIHTWHTHDINSYTRHIQHTDTCTVCPLVFCVLVLAQEVVSKGVPIALGAATAQQSPL